MQGNTSGGKQEQQGNKPSLSWSQPALQKPEQKPAQNLSMKSSAPAQPKLNGASKSSAGLYAGIFIGGLIVGVLVGWVVTGSRGSGEEALNKGPLSGDATTTQMTGEAMTGAMDESGLTIPTQAAGLTVSVSHVSVAAPTWVVVYEDHNGVAGNALGAGLFFPTSQGGASSGTIELLRGTTPGETYVAGESLDDGDRKFSLTLDKPVRDDKGNPLWVEFKTN